MVPSVRFFYSHDTLREMVSLAFAAFLTGTLDLGSQNFSATRMVFVALKGTTLVTVNAQMW